MANKTTAQPNVDIYLVNDKLKMFYQWPIILNSYLSILATSFYFACRDADLQRKLWAIAFAVSLVSCRVKLFGCRILKKIQIAGVMLDIN